MLCKVILCITVDECVYSASSAGDNVNKLFTHLKFCVNRPRGFGIMKLSVVPYFICLAGRPDNSIKILIIRVIFVYYNQLTCTT